MAAINRPLSNYTDANRRAVNIINMEASSTDRAVTCVTAEVDTNNALIVYGNQEMSELYHELHCNDVEH